MCRSSNFIFTVLNTVIAIIGIAAITTAAYLHMRDGTECQKALQNPLFIIGLFLFVIALLGLIGSCFDFSTVLWVYSFVTYLVIIGLIFFTGFAYIVTNMGAGRALSGLGYKEYRLGDYSNWLRIHFVNKKNWDGIRSCLIDAHVCRSLGKDGVNQKVADFYKRKLSPIQSGCCKPPSYCGFVFKNATFWTMPKSGPAVPDNDCRVWSNKQDKLCYDCDSCKGGVLANIRKDWRLLTIINICLVIFIIIVFFFSYFTRRSLRHNHPHPGCYYGHHHP